MPKAGIVYSPFGCRLYFCGWKKCSSIALTSSFSSFFSCSGSLQNKGEKIPGQWIIPKHILKTPHIDQLTLIFTLKRRAKSDKTELQLLKHGNTSVM